MVFRPGYRDEQVVVADTREAEGVIGRQDVAVVAGLVDGRVAGVFAELVVLPVCVVVAEAVRISVAGGEGREKRIGVTALRGC